jgi:PIN domain nuclease of toxin-antitoxin system
VPLKLPFDRWIRQATDPEVVKILPLDDDVVIALDSLPASFHGDPADRLIVATARAHDMPLATQDTRILNARVAKLWKP